MWVTGANREGAERKVRRPEKNHEEGRPKPTQKVFLSPCKKGKIIFLVLLYFST